MRFARPLTLSMGLLLAGCETTAPTPHAPPPKTPPPPVPMPAAAPIDWQDLPVTPGDWRYDPATATATFGSASDVTIRCDKGTRTVSIQRAGAKGPLKVRTSYGERAVTGPLAASDPLLDQMAFSRGRVSIESADTKLVVMPAWAEPARVFEDCRG